MTTVDATITSNGQYASVAVRDNRDHEHELTLDEEGTIHAHETDAYPADPDERTAAENELVSQARRYARYALLEEEDALLAVPPSEQPAMLFTAFQLIDTLSREQFDELFREVALQLASHEHEEITPLVPLPRTVSEDDFVFYRADLWIGLSEDFTAQHYQQYVQSAGLDTVVQSVNALLDDNPLAAGLSYFRNIGKIAAVEGPEPLDLLSINARSPIRPVIVKPDGRTVEPPAGNPVGEPPTVRIDLPPVAPGSRSEFREFLAYHLLCRARDGYLGMGIEPQREVFKVQGHGAHEYTQRYRSLEIYEDYHDPDADVSTWNPRDTAGDAR